MTTTPTPPAEATAQGHALEWDPPAAITATDRWTCFRPNCGRAVLDYRGHLYGSALTVPCPGAAVSGSGPARADDGDQP